MIELDDGSFDDAVGVGVVVVDFWAEWCGPCKMLSPIFDEVAEGMKDEVKFAKFNVDNGSIPSRFDITNIPTLLLFRDGKLIARNLGLVSKQILEKWIMDNIG